MPSTPDTAATFRTALAGAFDQVADPTYPYTDPAGAVWVSTGVPDNLQAIARVIRVHTLPGTRTFTLTKPQVSIDCFATGDNAEQLARTLALEVDAYVIWTLQRSVVDGVAVGLIETTATPAERPYTNNLTIRRFGMTYRPTLRAIA